MSAVRAIVSLLASDGQIHVWPSPLGQGDTPVCGVDDVWIQGPAFGSLAVVCDDCVHEVMSP